MSMFEDVKIDFSIKHSRRRCLRIPLCMRDLFFSDLNTKDYYDKDEGEALLWLPNDMKSLFDPVVEMILKLMSDQMRQARQQGAPPIECVVLVGGFGESLYVRERLTESVRRGGLG